MKEVKEVSLEPTYNQPYNALLKTMVEHWKSETGKDECFIGTANTGELFSHYWVHNILNNEEARPEYADLIKDFKSYKDIEVFKGMDWLSVSAFYKNNGEYVKDSDTGPCTFKWTMDGEEYLVGFVSIVAYDLLVQAFITDKEEVVVDMLNKFTSKKVYKIELSNGYWEVRTFNNEMYMAKMDLPVKETNSKFVDELKKLVSFYFTNRSKINGIKEKQEKAKEVAEFDFDMLGSSMGTVLVHGPVGTGKTTSINKAIKDEWHKDHVVVMCKSIQDLHYACNEVTDQGLSGIYILEECEAAFGKLDNSTGSANGLVKQFLEGSLTPYNKKGNYCIFVTNHPELISTDILQRKGRIENTIFVGNLDKEESYEAAKLHFKMLEHPEFGGFSVEEEVYSRFEGFSGDLIRSVAVNTLGYLISEDLDPKECSVNLDMVEKVIDKYYKPIESEDNAVIHKSKLGFRK